MKGKLGEGAKKTAFLAHDITLDREVAFALIKGETTDEDTRKRIKREAQTMAGLGDHPNIVPIYDFGDEGGQPFMVMPVMGGGSLEDLMKTTEGGGMELGSLLRIAIDVCRGLEFIHSKSVIHRDLKPGNVWLTDDGVAKIGDFGISVSQAYSRMTLEGTTLGTVLYMAPEQATAVDVDHRFDIYSLGAMLYEMATGQPPFSGVHPVAVISQHLNETPLSPMSRDPSCPTLLDTLIMLLLAKDPGDRPGSAGDVLAALAQIQEAGSDRTSKAEREEPALRVLLVEDSEDDALLVLHELRRGGYGLVSRRVETPADMKAEIEGSTWDLVLCDYSMPRFSAPAALKLLQNSGLDLPFIIVSGTISDEAAVAAMKGGAHDYVMKGNLSRLNPAVERELREAEERRGRRRAEHEERRLHLELQQRVKELSDQNSDLMAKVAQQTESVERYRETLGGLRKIAKEIDTLTDMSVPAPIPGPQDYKAPGRTDGQSDES